MLIAISQRRDKNRHGALIDNLDASYTEYMEKFGVDLLPVPNSSRHLEYYFEEAKHFKESFCLSKSSACIRGI